MSAPEKAKGPPVAPGSPLKTDKSKRKYSPRSTATEAQWARLIELTRTQSRDTYRLRAHGISHPSGRVRELVKRGYLFDVGRIVTTDCDAFTHRGVATYRLIAEPEDDQ